MVLTRATLCSAPASASAAASKYCLRISLTLTHGRNAFFHPADNIHSLRTAKIFYNLWGNEEQLAQLFPNLHIVAPMGYLEFNYLVEHAKVVVTDSGGIT